jgi:hypothetical protein
MSFRTEVAGYVELAKPRITTLLLIVALASYAIAAGSNFAWWSFFVVFASVGALGTGIFSLNQWMERVPDKLMARTARRPIPSGKIPEAMAFWFGMTFTVIGIGISAWWGNWLTGIISLLVALSYLLVYTPLKYKTAYHTALGALPEWNLADLFPGMESAEYASDLARAATDCAAFAEKWPRMASTPVYRLPSELRRTGTVLMPRSLKNC